MTGLGEELRRAAWAVAWDGGVSVYPPQRLWEPIGPSAARGSLAGLKSVGLYVHFPFCESRCRYCYTLSVAGAGTARRQSYLECLKTELELLEPPAGLAADTLYIGGGTPSLLSGRELDGLMGELSRRVRLDGCREKLMELDPDSLSEGLARSLGRWGFDAVTLGVQTTDEALLRRMGRARDPRSPARAAGLCRRAGVRRIAVDVMAGLPGQTMPSFQKTLAGVLRLEPDTVYINPFVPNRRVVLARPGVRESRVDPVERERMERWGRRWLARRRAAAAEESGPGSNLQAADGSVRLKAVLGLGYGAVSHVPFKLRWTKAGGLPAYERALRAGRWPALLGAESGAQDERRWYAVYHLQTRGEIALGEFASHFGLDWPTAFPKETALLERCGAAGGDSRRWRLKVSSRRGRHVLAALFMSAEVRGRVLRAGPSGPAEAEALGAELGGLLGL